MSNAKADFRRGVEAAQEAVKGGNFARTEFFGLEDGKVAILRFLTDADGWITVLQHQMIKTKAQPEGWSGNWPDKMGSVCRNDPAFSGLYEDCYICDFIVADESNKVKSASARVWALACDREEVMEGGKRVGLRDQTREVVIPAREAEGDKPARAEEKMEEKAILVVNMGLKNFFGILAGYAAKNGTILDRDFWIKRQGSDLSTQYQIIAEDPIMKDGEIFDLREKKFMDRYESRLDLEEVILERSSDEYYAKFFDPRYTADDGKVKETGASPEAKPTTEISAEKMEAMASRVRGYSSVDGEASENGSGKSAEAGEQPEQPAEPVTQGAMRDFD